MLRLFRSARGPSTRSVARAESDMALASTIVFFGILPVVMATGLVMVQALAAFAP